MLRPLRGGEQSDIRLLQDIGFFDAECCAERQIGPEAALNAARQPDVSAVIGGRRIIGDLRAGKQVLVRGKPVGPAEIGADAVLLLRPGR